MWYTVEVQAKDISDKEFLELVDRLEKAKGMWVHTWDIQKESPWPPKIILAKAKRLISRGLITGCACGCRGDFELTDLGAAFIMS